MSCTGCERESDNKSFQCPAKMADGRAFTDYKPRCAVLSSLLQDKPMNTYELRQHMINNAEAIMQQKREYASRMNSCGPCVQPWNQGTMLPEQTMVRCNESTCSVSKTNANGLGQGRDYGIPEETAFIRKMEEANIPQVGNVCTGYDDDTRYYPVAVEEERYAIPSGGQPFY